MIRKLLGLSMIACLGLPLMAEDKKEDKDRPLKGTWVREAEGLTLTFEFTSKTEMTVSVEGGGNGCIVKCKYEADKDGKLKATVTEVKEKGEFPAKPPKGFEFKCTFKIEKDTAKLSDFEGDGAEGAKPVIEGEYKAKKSD